MSDPDLSGEFVTTPCLWFSRGHPPQADKSQGGFSFGTFLWDRTKKSTYDEFKLKDCFCTPSLRAQRRGTPKKGHPGVSRPPVADALAGHMNRGVATNSHNWALKQRGDPAPLSCARLGCETMGVKVKNKVKGWMPELSPA